MPVDFVKPVLLVEDSPAIARVVSQSIITRTGHPTRVVHSFAAARKLVSSPKSKLNFLAAVVDLVLPDAPDGQIVDLTLVAGIPTIVLTGKYSDETRRRILSKDVVDYFFKSGGSLDLLSEAIWRLEINQDIQILVVNNCPVLGTTVSHMLRIHRFEVLEAQDKQTVRELLDESSELSLVILCNPRDSDADVELVAKIRELHSFDHLGIIAVSNSDSSLVAGRFLKNGADDFIKEPFGKEEFYSRIYRGIKTLESIRRLRLSAHIDPLTNIYNRLYFFETAPKIYESTKARGGDLAVAMLDIDFFKTINDKYGHEGGDLALRQAAYLLRDTLEKADIISRFGGEEFCVLLSNCPPQETRKLFGKLREQFENTSFRYGSQTINFTVSVGISTQSTRSLDKMIGHADNLLYKAKKEGRNRVYIE